MDQRPEKKPDQDPGGPKGPPGSCKGWLKLAAWVGGLVFFLYVLGPWGLKLPLFRQIVKVIEEENINANAYYYTEVEQFSDADFAMRANRTYGPKAPMKASREKP